MRQTGAVNVRKALWSCPQTRNPLKYRHAGSMSPACRLREARLSGRDPGASRRQSRSARRLPAQPHEKGGHPPSSRAYRYPHFLHAQTTAPFSMMIRRTAPQSGQMPGNPSPFILRFPCSSMPALFSFLPLPACTASTASLCCIPPP